MRDVADPHVTEKICGGDRGSSGGEKCRVRLLALRL